MHATSADLIHRYYAAFNAGNMQVFLNLLTDDVIHDINQSGREVGRDAFVAFMQRMNTSYREQIVNITVLVSDDGLRAAAEFTVLGEYLKTDEGLPPATGQKYTLPAGAFFDIKAGKVARISNYYNLQDWLKQVGA